MSRYISPKLLLLVTLFVLPVFSVSVARVEGHEHDHDSHASVHKRLPSQWYQRDDHPVHALFKRGKRDNPTDGGSYAPVGSPTWSAGYPQTTPDPASLPKAWVDALNAAVAAGKIPDFPPSVQNGGNPTYGNLDPNGDVVCSRTYKCRKNEDIWDAPEGTFGAGFDDGPLPTSDALYDFLQKEDIPATHFFIGVNILNNPKEFMTAFETLGNDIAVHTYTHPYMTTLDNMALLGQFGWTMEIIHNSTGGRLPKYWRPPYGDSDNRVQAIAREVFGLQAIIWNQDTEDWSIGSPNGATVQGVNAQLTKWVTGPKSPGLIILEHELSNYTVQAFIDIYPAIKSNGWKVISAAQLDGGSAYSNADGDDGTVTPVSGILATNGTSSVVSSSSSSAAPTSTSSGAPSSASAPGGAKQANGGSGSSSSSSHAPSPTGANQSSGALSLHWFLANDVAGMLAAFVTVLLSAVVLA